MKHMIAHLVDINPSYFVILSLHLILFVVFWASILQVQVHIH